LIPAPDEQDEQSYGDNEGEENVTINAGEGSLGHGSEFNAQIGHRDAQSGKEMHREANYFGSTGA
jgi:hypothetical protein